MLEMYVHHLSTGMLMASAYQSGYIKLCSLMLFIHDWADVTTGMLKIFVETRFKTLTIVLAIINVFIWFYSRCYALPLIIYEIAVNQVPKIYTING